MEKSKWSEHCKPHARGDGPVIEAQAEADANVNPTHVGMDRPCTGFWRNSQCKPHARGDGPECVSDAYRWADVNPTHVGMDRIVRQE